MSGAEVTAACFESRCWAACGCRGNQRSLAVCPKTLARCPRCCQTCCPFDPKTDRNARLLPPTSWNSPPLTPSPLLLHLSLLTVFLSFSPFLPLYPFPTPRKHTLNRNQNTFEIHTDFFEHPELELGLQGCLKCYDLATWLMSWFLVKCLQTCVHFPCVKSLPAVPLSAKEVT